ncbi:enoyl-CoA hydratase/isomerase family protein [Natrialbaceae archaeon A-CW1-1]
MSAHLSALDAEFENVTVTPNDGTDHITTVVIDRPEARNAMNAQVRAELKEAFDAIDESDTRVVVLTGSDEASAFVAGADVTELHERTALEQREVSKRPRVYEYVSECRVPVIARINGHALGGGCELAMAADVRIASERAKLGLPEITLGLFPGGGGTQRLPRLVGQGKAMQLILSGDLIDAEEAHEIGLVDELTSEDELDDSVADLAGSIASNSPIALEFAKRAIRASGSMGLDNGIEYEAELFAQALATDDVDEGISAFLEDREPEWVGH